LHADVKLYSNAASPAGKQLNSRWKIGEIPQRILWRTKLPPLEVTEVAMIKREFAKRPSVQLTPEQELEAQRLADSIAVRTKEELLEITRLLVSKQDHELFGKTEFEVRDLVHKIGARAIETAVNERKKRATKGRA
jgi:hypothetical protein